MDSHNLGVADVRVSLTAPTGAIDGTPSVGGAAQRRQPSSADGPGAVEADGDADGVAAGAASVTDTRTSAGALPSVDSAPWVGVRTSSSSTVSPGIGGAWRSRMAASVPPGCAAEGVRARDAGTGTAMPAVDTQVATRRAGVRVVRSQLRSESDSAGGVVETASHAWEPALTTRIATLVAWPVRSSPGGAEGRGVGAADADDDRLEHRLCRLVVGDAGGVMDRHDEPVQAGRGGIRDPDAQPSRHGSPAGG